MTSKNPYQKENIPYQLKHEIARRRNSVGAKEFMIDTWNKYNDKTCKVIKPGEPYGWSSFPEVEKYEGLVGKVERIEFTINGRGEYIYIKGCPLPLSDNFLEILD